MVYFDKYLFSNAKAPFYTSKDLWTDSGAWKVLQVV